MPRRLVAQIRNSGEQGMSAEPVKRSQYFNPPSTECPHSSRNHFEDWEEFHLPMARMHHAALHGRGVASGLEVSVQEAGAQIEVGPGVAVNRKGELIALSAEGQADIGSEQPGERASRSTRHSGSARRGGRAGTYYLCIQFAQALRFTEGSCGKLEQTPSCACCPTAGDARSDRGGGGDRPRDRARSMRRASRRCGTGPRRCRTVASWSGHGGASCGFDAPTRPPKRSPMRRPPGSARAMAAACGFSVADAADAIILDAEDGGQFSRLEVQADEARLAGDVEVLGSLGLASWRLQAGGSEPDPTLDLQPIADEKSFRLVSHDGGHVPLQVRPSSSGDGNAVYLAQTGGRVGIGTTTPGEQLDVAGRVKAGPMSIGPWPANVANYVFVGVNTLNQGAAGNYALLQGVTDGPRPDLPQFAH